MMIPCGLKDVKMLSCITQIYEEEYCAYCWLSVVNQSRILLRPYFFRFSLPSYPLWFLFHDSP